MWSLCGFQIAIASRWIMINSIDFKMVLKLFPNPNKKPDILSMWNLCGFQIATATGCLLDIDFKMVLSFFPNPNKKPHILEHSLRKKNLIVKVVYD